MKLCQTLFLKMKAPKQNFQIYLTLWLNKIKNCKQDWKFSLFPENEKEEEERGTGREEEERGKKEE